MNATDIRPFKTWTPAAPRRQPDNIVSSSYTTTRVFVPSYEKEGHPRIEQLLSNDYQRIWWKEKQAWDKTITEKKVAIKKILPRTLIKRKVPSCVTVKYQTRAERSRGRRKEHLTKKANSNNKIEEETTSAKHDTKLEKEHEEIKLEEREETRSQKSERTDDELQKEHEETISEKEETKLQKSEEIKLDEHEEEKKCEEAKSEKNEEIKLEKSEEIKSEKREEAQQLKNNEDTNKTERHEELKLENE
ncbi:trichohyalin-like, partial [Nylanderia fulva]|uniref:trichohyalin-like n=1 Tax=Nylanderia fulva TaxID=613905 RepID=UPI0010FB3292